MRITVSIVIALLSLPGFAQEPVAVAPVPIVEHSGFYRIKLSPTIVSYLSTGFGNARVKDGAGKEVPYLVDEESRNYSGLAFRDYRMDRRATPNCCTELILYNPARARINNISLQIRNADTHKYATLLGSDDKKQWYALREKFAFYPVDGVNETTEMRIVDFPLSDYSFYKLSIDDSSSAPLNIIRAGYYETNMETGRYSEIAGVRLKTENKTVEKETWVTLSMDTTALTDRILLHLKGPPFYHRYAYVIARYWQKDQKGKLTDYLQEVESFTLNSRTEPSVALGSIRAEELVIKIQNDDNPPLDVKGAQLFQLNRYLVSWLEAGNAYHVEVGAESQSAPVYDLAFFRDSIPASPAQVAVGEVVLRAKPTGRQSFTLFTNRNIIWVAIIVVVALLAYMSRKMIKDVSAKSK